MSRKQDKAARRKAKLKAKKAHAEQFRQQHHVRIAAFVRSILPQGEETNPAGRNLMRKTPDQIFPVETLLRSVVSAFGWKLEYQAIYSRSMLPRMNITRHENMFFFTVFCTRYDGFHENRNAARDPSAG